MAISRILYRATAAATGGRSGRARSSDGALDVHLSQPRELGGEGGFGTNPEQLFAAGYSACFLGALRHVAVRHRIALPASTSISTTIGIGPTASGFALEADLRVTIPGMARTQAQELVEAAHEVCPYSHATRNNIDVRLHVLV